MIKEQIRYIQKYININSERIYENSDVIDDLVFYRKEINLQRQSKNDLLFKSDGDMLLADRERISKSIYDILNCSPVNNFEYPENKKFAVCLTHDIDDIYPPISHTLLSSAYCIKNLNFKELKKQLFWNGKGKEFSPYWNFKEIMNIEEKYGAKSSFYFMATDRDVHRFRYNIEDLEKELGLITDKGCEVGLHGGYYAYKDLEEIQKEKRRLENVLGQDVIGYRNHYLMFKIPDTWKLLTKAGFKYDTTFGYNDMIGFRNGMCHPFKPFDLDSNKEINILEIPLTIMDIALMKSSVEAWRTAKMLIDIVEKYNGILTLSWHNNTFNCPFRKRWFMMYEKILKYCYNKNAWMANGEEIYDFGTEY